MSIFGNGRSLGVDCGILLLDGDKSSSCCLSTRPASLSVHCVLCVRDCLPRSNRRKALRRPRFGTSEAGWLGLLRFRKRNWIGKSSSSNGVMEFLDAR